MEEYSVPNEDIWFDFSREDVTESYIPVGGDLSSTSREMRSLGEIWSSWSISYTEKIYSHVTTSNSNYLVKEERTLCTLVGILLHPLLSNLTACKGWTLCVGNDTRVSWQYVVYPAKEIQATTGNVRCHNGFSSWYIIRVLRSTKYLRAADIERLGGRSPKSWQNLRSRFKSQRQVLGGRFEAPLEIRSTS